LLEDFEKGNSTETTYDPKGLPAMISLKKKDKEISRQENRYDEAGRIIEQSTIAGSARGLHMFSYAEGGTLKREEFYEGDDLIRTLDYGENQAMEEELFADGRVFVRVHYEDGMKVLEEFISDGVVTRQRRFR
jgi:antitoxin component YwqK of YwqJK toxin-antitoxin module